MDNDPTPTTGPSSIRWRHGSATGGVDCPQQQKNDDKNPGLNGPGFLHSYVVEAGDSNPRPLQCDCSALPTELRPRDKATARVYVYE